MATQAAFTINGVIDTNQPVLSNLEKITSACATWLSYDITTGLWSVVINRAGTSVKSFNTSNIIGAVNVNGTGIDSLYNTVEIRFPNKDVRDQTSYINLAIPLANRFPNEPENVLSLQYDIINDPVQAQYLGIIELKQSRVDKVIQFRTDYTALGLQGGDLIDITLGYLGWTNKVFRITKISEEDAQDGSIQLAIDALEYDADVYSSAGLSRDGLNIATGIKSNLTNTNLINSNNSAAVNALNAGLGTDAQAATNLTKALTNYGHFIPLIDTFQVANIVVTADTTEHVIDLGHTFTIPYTGTYRVTYTINWGSNISVSPPLGCLKLSSIKLKLNGTLVSSLGNYAFTGDQHVQVFEDHIITGVFSANKGDTLTYLFGGTSNLSSGYYSVPSGYPTFTVASGVNIGAYITSDLYFTGS